MAGTHPHRRRRVVISLIICSALAGGAAAAIAARKPGAKVAGAAPSIFKTATVKRGDLTTTETVDGSVQLSSTLTVLHRIEGQTSSSSTPASTASTPATNSASNGSTNAVTSSVPQSANLTEAFVDCTSTTVAEQSTITTAPADSTTTTTTTTTPETTPDTTPDTTTTTSTTVVQLPTAPCDTTPATTATPDTPETTLSVTPGGGATRTGGTATGASRTAAGSTAAGASTARITQTITSIIATNTAIQPGDVLYTVDGSPVVALDGALPAWRSLSTSSADGIDIAQLEASLVALGYDPAQKVIIDNHFDSATRTMVKAWQRGLGVEATGTVALGSVVFLPATTTVSAVARAVGDKVGDGDAVLTLAAPTQEVLIDVPTGDEAQVVPGLEVKIGQVQGAVTRLRSADRNGSVIVEAVIAPAAEIAGAGNGSAVKVTLTLQNNSGVLIAPAEALVSRLDGTYAVEEQMADGSTKWLTVELLGVSGGNVAIRGTDLSEGTVVLLPA